MKNSLKSLLLAGAMFCFVHANAQDGVKRTARKVGHKTSEIAAKGKSSIVDKKYKDKCGPHGETVYINKNDKFYYVSKRGHRVYLKRSELMDKHHMKM